VGSRQNTECRIDSIAPSARTSSRLAVVLAERLRARVASGGKDLEGRGATVSIGIASLVASRDERPASASLMAAADESSYLA
jgi:PleD family two-component response regulator